MANKPMKSIKWPGLEDTYTFVQNDATLSVSGAAADAKVTGDKISDLKSNLSATQEIANGLEDAMPSELFDTESITSEITYSNIVVNYEGNQSASTTRVTSNFIRLGRNISVSNSNTSSPNGQQYWIRVFNKNKQFIANATFTGENTCDVGTGSSYGTTGVAKANLDNIMGKNSNAAYVRIVVRYMATSTTPITPSDVWLTYTGDVLSGGSLDDVYARLPIAANDTEFFERERSENLFNPETIVTGRLKNDGTLDSTATTYRTSDYIDLRGLTGTYVVCGISAQNIGQNGYAFYKADKTFISGSGGSSTSAISIPANAVFFRMSYSGASNTYNYYVVVNNSGTGTDNKVYYDRSVLASQYMNSAGWYAGKLIAALGDSITENGNYLGEESTHSGWRRFVAVEMSLSSDVYNCGIGGTKVSGSGANAMWQDVRINSIPETADVVLFNGGMNDWGGDVALGEEDSTDTDTFYGALNTIATKLIDHVPNAFIFWMTTTYGEQANGVSKNALDLTTYDYGRAIKKVAEKNGFPVIDLHALCGWNGNNVATYVNDEGDTTYIHPNIAGGKRITTAICSVLRAYQPYV